MPNSNQSFNPRLIINDHFDLIINKIDIQTETLLLNQSLSKEKINELNKTRQEQIDKLREIEQFNLSGVNLLEYEEKWSTLIDDQSFNFEQKVEKIKQDLIAADCILLEQEKIINGFNLWITSEFYNKNDLEFLE
jgi:hypothetical protein